MFQTLQFTFQTLGLKFDAKIRKFSEGLYVSQIFASFEGWVDNKNP